MTWIRPSRSVFIQAATEIPTDQDIRYYGSIVPTQPMELSPEHGSHHPLYIRSTNIILCE